MAGKALLFLIILLPVSLHAQVYRCDGRDGPVYSQIPCEENAEMVVIYDPVAKTDDDPALVSEQDEPVETVEKQPTPMENFVTTLHNQRRQQIGQIDQTIIQLKEMLEAEGEQALEEPEREAAASKLATLESDRDSIVEQYASLIGEAERRAGAVDAIN